MLITYQIKKKISQLLRETQKFHLNQNKPFPNIYNAANGEDQSLRGLQCPALLLTQQNLGIIDNKKSAICSHYF